MAKIKQSDYKLIDLITYNKLRKEFELAQRPNIIAHIKGLISQHTITAKELE